MRWHFDIRGWYDGPSIAVLLVTQEKTRAKRFLSPYNEQVISFMAGSFVGMSLYTCLSSRNFRHISEREVWYHREPSAEYLVFSSIVVELQN